MAANIIKAIPSQLLGFKVSDKHIGLLGFQMKEWEEYAPVLGLKQSDIDTIREDHKSVVVQAQKSLIRWKEIEAFKATNHNLIVVFCSVERQDLGEKLKRLLLHEPDDSNSERDILDNFQMYLKDCYDSFNHPSCTQWPFSVLQSYVDLSLFDVPKIDKSPSNPGNNEDNNSSKPIALDNLFLAGDPQAKRKVLLLEGVAGAGKTTLLWHSCKKWAAGELFNDVQLLIHLSLNDPDIASAKCLADIIPHSSKKMREAVAEAIGEKGGKGICFFFDACDEAPSALWDSFLYQFLEGKGRNALKKCSVVLAARPEINRKSLSQVLTARVRIEGFESSKLEAYLDLSLSSDQLIKKELAQTLKINPQLVGLCSLPLNAAILVHLYHFLKDNLPSTTTGLFKPLVLNLLLRYIQHTKKEHPEIKDFSALPEDILPKFNAVCKLAYSAFMNHTRIFSEQMLEMHNLRKTEDAMGFLKFHQQLTAFGSSYRFSFLHLSLQEFLAAVHIQNMSDHHQVQTVQRILQITPLSPVLPFYAGLTKLSNRATFNLLSKVTEVDLDPHSVMQTLSKSPTYASDRRRLFLALTNCIYETQLSTLIEEIPSIKFRIICLNELPLIPSDCLSLGFFMGNISNLFLMIAFCSISDIGLHTLVNQMKHSHFARKQTATNVIDISNNRFRKQTLPLLKDMLQILYEIKINHCWYCCPNKLLTTIIEGLQTYSNLCEIAMGSCNIGPSHIYHLIILILTAKNLERLLLDDNNIGSVMYLFSEALKISNLRGLSLARCQIDNSSLGYLSDTVSQHPHLTNLVVDKNNYNPTSVTRFLNQLLKRNTVLELLKLEFYTLNAEQVSLIDQINEKRMEKKRPHLTVTQNPWEFEVLKLQYLSDYHRSYRQNPQLHTREQN